jgi:subtilisin family serine protease
MIRVSVFDVGGAVIRGAHVALEARAGGSGSVPLAFNRELAGFVKDDVPPGAYVLVVSAQDLETQRRAVNVDKEDGLSETVILGRPGWPHYYRGTAWVPYEPLPLVGVAFEGSADVVERNAKALAERFQLEEVPVAPAVSSEGIRVFRTDEQRLNELQAALLDETARKRAGIRHAGPVVSNRKSGVAFLTNEFIVKFKPALSGDDVKALVTRLGCTIVRPVPYVGNAFLIRARDAKSGLDVCDQLVASGQVEYAEPNLVASAHDDQVTPSDFLFAQQWHLPLVNLPDAWAILRGLSNVPPGAPGDLTFGSENITIAIFDRGIPSQTVAGVVQAAHPDFAGPVTSGAPKISVYFDFVNMVPNNDSVSSNHGVRCAGLAAALANNPSPLVPTDVEGVVGAAPNCRVMALIRNAAAGELQYADAYIWMGGLDPHSTDPGFPPPLAGGTCADVISSSFGLDGSVGAPISGLMKDTFDCLTTFGRGGKGTVLCFSSGDAPTDFQLQRPWAAYGKTIAVAASTAADTRPPFGGFGMGIDVCAPGGNGLKDLVTCDLPSAGDLAGTSGARHDYTRFFNGTSASTPIVAGVAALILSARPGLSWSAVRKLLTTTAVQIDLGNTDPDGHWMDLNGDGTLDYSKWYGYGRVDAKAAVCAALETLESTANVPSAPTNLRIVP